MNINNKIISILKQKNIKLSVAESCTGGMLSSAITSVSGSSKVPKKIIQKYGAVSIQCCLSMINNLSKISKSKICISITGIAGPKGGTNQKPVGLVYIGLKNGKKVIISKNQFKNNGRSSIQKASVNKALNLLLKSIK